MRTRHDKAQRQRQSMTLFEFHSECRYSRQSHPYLRLAPNHDTGYLYQGLFVCEGIGEVLVTKS